MMICRCRCCCWCCCCCCCCDSFALSCCRLRASASMTPASLLVFSAGSAASPSFVAAWATTKRPPKTRSTPGWPSVTSKTSPRSRRQTTSRSGEEDKKKKKIEGLPLSSLSHLQPTINASVWSDASLVPGACCLGVVVLSQHSLVWVEAAGPCRPRLRFSALPMPSKAMMHAKKDDVPVKHTPLLIRVKFGSTV
jgi:hypothetical protein